MEGGIISYCSLDRALRSRGGGELQIEKAKDFAFGTFAKTRNVFAVSTIF